MEILFLGTCACDYSPKLKDQFKDKFDFDARRSSSALINENIVIDCGDHFQDEARIAGVDLSKVTDILITHLHGDHFRVKNVEYIASKAKRGVRLWVREDARLDEIEGVEIMRMKDGVTYDMGGNVSVTGLKANHDEIAFPQHLVLEQDGKKLLYALDGAWFLHSTYYWLKNKNLDLAVLDATCGDYVGDYIMGEHNSIPMIRLMLPSLKKWGTVNDDTQIYLSHLAPSLHKPHAETAAIVEKDGLKVAYDGLKVSI